jgi:hypothetical protein
VRHLFLSLVTVVTLTVSGRAGEFKLPDDDPVASFTIPSSWKPSEFEDGVEATSDDGSVYITVEAANVSSSEDATKAMSESVKYLVKKGVTLDSDSAKQTKSKINGMDVINVIWKGKDADGPCEVSLTIFVVTPKKGLLLTYWGPAEGAKKYDADLTAIVQSIKPL